MIEEKNAVKEKEMSKAMSEMESRVIILEELTAKVGNNFAGVMREPTPSEEPEDKSMGYESPIPGEISTFAERIKKVNEKLDDYVGRCEL